MINVGSHHAWRRSWRRCKSSKKWLLTFLNLGMIWPSVWRTMYHAVPDLSKNWGSSEDRRFTKSITCYGPCQEFVIIVWISNYLFFTYLYPNIVDCSILFISKEHTWGWGLSNLMTALSPCCAATQSLLLEDDIISPHFPPSLSSVILKYNVRAW